MAYIRGLGCYLPGRVVGNQEVSNVLGADPSWIFRATGIEQRRYAASEESVSDMGALAARDCLTSAGVSADEIGLIVVACGSSERRFPGPATAIGSALGIGGTPAVDLPIASAGSLFGIALAARLCPSYRNVLVIATEIMSRVVRMDPVGRDAAILFGDGAGACLISADAGFLQITDSVLHSDGEFAGALHLELNAPLHMDGRTIILQASRKLPRAVSEILARNHVEPNQIGTFLRELSVRLRNPLFLREYVRPGSDGTAIAYWQ